MDSEAVNQWLDADQVRALAESLLTSAPPSDPSPNESFYGENFEGFAEAVPVQSGEKVQAIDPETKTRSNPAEIISDFQRAPQPVEPKDQNVVTPPLDKRPARSPFSPESAHVEQPVVKEGRPMPESPQGRGAAEQKPADVASPPPAKVVPVDTQPSAPAPAPAAKSPFKIAKEQPLGNDQPDVSKSPGVVQSGTPRKLPFSSRLDAFGVWLKEQIPTQAYFICDRNGELVVDEVGSEKLVKVARTLAHASRNAGRQVGDNEALESLHVKIGPERVMEVVPRQSQYGLVVLGLIVPRPLSTEAVGSVSRGLGTVLADQSSPG